MIYLIEGVRNELKEAQIVALTNMIAEKHRFPLNIRCVQFGLPTNGKSRSYSEMYYYKLMKDAIKLSDTDIYDVIIDNSWLSENVVAPLYRGKPGEYVFEIEKQLIGPADAYGFRLITLIDSSNEEYKDDDELYKETHNKSAVENKILIDMANLSRREIKAKVKTFIDGL